MTQRRAKGFAEEDTFGPWRRFYCYLSRAGVKSKIKRQARRRERREAKAALDAQAMAMLDEEIDKYFAESNDSQWGGPGTPFR